MIVSPDGIFSTAQWINNARNGGGTYDPEGFGYRWRIVLHTIEGSANPGMIAGHAFPPHIWYDPATRKLYQTVPLTRSAFALYQASDAPHYTNKARALQVEIAGHAAETAFWPQAWLDNLTVDVIVPLCQWVASQGGSINLNNAPAPGIDSMSARENAPQRLTSLEWALCDGLVSHRHIPQNDHWDTGQLDTPRIAQHAAMIIGSELLAAVGRNVPLEDEDDMAIIATLRAPGDPQDGSMWAVDGLFKRRLSSFQEYERMLATNQARKQPNGAGWVDMTMTELQAYTTINEWSLAALPDLVSAAVGEKLDRTFAELPMKIASAVAAALRP